MGKDSRQAQFSGVRPVQAAHRFDEARLAAFMAEHVPGFQGPLIVEQFKGGQSNPTYRLRSPSGAWVLRRKPPGQLLPSAHAVDREYRVIKALGEAGFPVPGAVLLCEDASVVGTMFYLMDYVPGRITWEATMPGSDPAQRAAIYDQVNATLAWLHSLSPQALGLGDFARPGNYFARQIGRWSRQYQASATGTIVEMDRLIDWLPGNIPADEATAIVHGDYRLDNVILHPERPEVLAVLDWELSTLGHPLGDFTYHLMQWRLPQIEGFGISTLAGVDVAALGIPTEDEYVAMYCDRVGRSGIENRDFYFAYNFFRLAAIVQGIAGRVRDGTASSAHAKVMAAQVRPLAELAWRFARDAGAV
jgi:aminoglycoside phosphotransferase (APT) family kinase protein